MTEVGYEPELVRVEASQKGWLLVRALADLTRAITYLLASGDHDWQIYDVAKGNALRALAVFEVWHGRG